MKITMSKQYRESNTHELYGKYGAYVSPIRFKSGASGCEGCARGSRKVKRLIVLKRDRQALIVHAVYKSRMITSSMQELNAK